jgi:spermidine synthase
MGTSVLVNSIIIGVYLLALSYGYKRGAQYTDNLNAVLARNLLFASGFLGIGLSYWFIYVFFSVAEKILQQGSLFALILYLSLIIAPLVYFLGQTVPITMNLINQDLRPGAVGGRVLHLSALGSFLGAISTTIIFMHYLGVTWTVVINCGLLVLAVLLIYYKEDHLKNSSIIALAMLPIVFVVNQQEVLISPLASNEYSNYLIVPNHKLDDNRVGSILAVNHSPSSFAENDTLQGFSYIEKIKEIVFKQLRLQDKKILVLGAGGFSLSAAGDHGNKFVYVDIDPNLKKIVAKNFLPQINGEFIASDARLYLRKNSNKYDVIISDVYSNKSTIPQHLLTKEYFQLISKNLQDNGLALFNIIMDPFLRDKYSSRVDNTIRSAFSNCSITTIDYSGKRSNVIYICQTDTGRDRSEIYTDNNNSSAFDVIML